jgi:cysteine synthase
MGTAGTISGIRKYLKEQNRISKSSASIHWFHPVRDLAEQEYPR